MCHAVYQILFWLWMLLYSGSRVSCLQMSNCNKTEVTMIRGMELLTSLTLSNCSLPHLENAFFMRFGHLLHLELQHSGLSSLEDFSLHGLPRLQSLSFAHNSLSKLRSWSSEPLEALVSLDLSHNRLSSLDAHSFVLYPQLQMLDLGSNQINQIADDAFYGLSHLKHLQLNGNRMMLIDGSQFHGLHRLSSLTLQHNLIEGVDPGAFESNTHLRSLRLDGNLLNCLQFLTQSGLARLVHLNLANNLLNKLEPQGFVTNVELQVLDLSRNNFTELTKESLVGLDSLERLNISHNILSHIEDGSLESLASLLQVDASFNQLTSVSESLFHANTQLEEIILSHNRIRDISPKLMQYQTHLRHLKLDGNALIEASFLQRLPPALNRLSLIVDLSSNRLQSVNLNSLLHFGHINLADNHWSCAWLVKNLLLRAPPSLNFARNWSLLSDWSEDLTKVQGIDCIEDARNRSIVLLSIGEVIHSKVQCAKSFDELNPAPPPLTWPKIPTDRFDSRSVIIWMLVAIAITFACLRWLRRFVDRKEQSKRKLKAINEVYISKMESQPIRHDRERS
ncbi:leucine-rich repeats and immunoglobulin-like domains protein 2 [Drosophila pseudoobscura]|uniref:Leucine-rich repeats and immunoglobulin-like domains protein 2 n=1 Tax=Drosophila pseudoobscura pseudoobscura TaxID=46245 RepID=A0A6I8UIX8_DROPS|nr:leucine-rich repeats and immunoglobulin-like domains protein 2 [Drosophila pseudoobscura]